MISVDGMDSSESSSDGSVTSSGSSGSSCLLLFRDIVVGHCRDEFAVPVVGFFHEEELKDACCCWWEATDDTTPAVVAGKAFQRDVRCDGSVFFVVGDSKGLLRLLLLVVELWLDDDGTMDEYCMAGWYRLVTEAASSWLLGLL